MRRSESDFLEVNVISANTTGRSKISNGLKQTTDNNNHDHEIVACGCFWGQSSVLKRKASHPAQSKDHDDLECSLYEQPLIRTKKRVSKSKRKNVSMETPRIAINWSYIARHAERKDSGDDQNSCRMIQHHREKSVVANK